MMADAGVRVQEQYEFVLGAGAKAKTVISPLIIPSVLGNVNFFSGIKFLLYL